MTALVEAIRQILNLIASGEWATVGALTSGSDVSGEDLHRAICDYGRTPISAPHDLESFVDIVRAPNALSVVVPLWTVEEGRSDLELRLSAEEVLPGVWQLQVDDVLVP